MMMERQPSLIAAQPAAPSLSSTSSNGDAYEIKFRLTVEEAGWAEAWARRHLTPDPHGDNGVYRTTSLYLDTPFLDIYHKTPGYRSSKYRLRRYGCGEVVHLERKRRRGDRVRKRRDAIALSEVPALLDGDTGGWFGILVRQQLLRPICWIGYSRTAVVSATANGPLRLTLDRDVIGATASSWTVPAHVDGRPLLPGEAILELKFHLRLPVLFHELLAGLPSRLAGVSKYSRCVETWELARR
jgi:hypothetical protein